MDRACPRVGEDSVPAATTLRPRIHGRAARDPRRDGGYTLIELSAVLAIAIVLIVAGIGTLRSVRKADISTAASRLSASVRYLYDLAVVTNRPYRLVVDLASNAYWGEPADPSMGCGGAALLPSDEERKFDEENPEEEGEEGAGGSGSPAPAAGMVLAQPDGIAAMLQGSQAPSGRGARTARAAPAGGEGGPGGEKRSRERLLERFTLPKGLVFPRVMTGHQDDPTEEGKAEVYFFPSGYVERAYIYLQRDDEIYTVETVPLKGAALVHREELDPADLLDES